MESDNNKELIYSTMLFGLVALVIITTALIFSVANTESLKFTKSPIKTAFPTETETVDERIVALERDNRELRYQRDMAEIHTDLIGRQTSWFQILIAAFGVLITSIVIYFSFNFSKAAVAEAKNTVHDDHDKMKLKIEGLINQARVKVKEIDEDAKKAKALFEGIPFAEIPKDQIKKRSLLNIAREAEIKKRRERTADDYKALITIAQMDEDWSRMQQRALEMHLLFEEDENDEINSFALFHRAFALYKLGKFEKSEEVYRDFIDKYKSNELVVVQKRLAAAIRSKGYVLYCLQRFKEAIVEYDILIKAIPTAQEEICKYQGIKAMNNKGAALYSMKQFDDAIEVYDNLIDSYKTIDIPIVKEQVSDALFNKACIYAKQSQIKNTKTALGLWSEFEGMMDCQKIINEDDFKNVRNKPTLKKFLKDNGC